ncbi:hypothetical protein U0070_001813 [Myodes glareolus]|uniref:Cytochrome c oxidase subunit 7A2, mitochondrial n=1 Tax=Myodes glareolus TaxID=447135 RepID=A0AAW0ISK8_MYOGA
MVWSASPSSSRNERSYWTHAQRHKCGFLLQALRQIAQRTVSTTSRRNFENKVSEKQKLFQEDNGVPVHLKGGASDALLYRLTMALTVGGTAYALYQLAVAAFPKKQN